MFRTLFLKFLKWSGKVYSHHFLSNISRLSNHSTTRCVLVGWLPADVMKVFSFSQLALLCKGRLWIPVKSDWGTISLRHLTSKRSVCLVSNYKVCFPSSIWPMISLLAWSKNRLCTWTVHLLSVRYLVLSTLDFMQFWSNPLWWFKWAFVLDAAQR